MMVLVVQKIDYSNNRLSIPPLSAVTQPCACKCVGVCARTTCMFRMYGDYSYNRGILNFLRGNKADLNTYCAPGRFFEICTRTHKQSTSLTDISKLIKLFHVHLTMFFSHMFTRMCFACTHELLSEYPRRRMYFPGLSVGPARKSRN